MAVLCQFYKQMSTRIYLTRRVGLEIGGNPAVDERYFRRRQERLVFTYLVCERARPVSREELARVVWPDKMPTAWQTALSALVSRLRRLLATTALCTSDASISRCFEQYQPRLPGDT